MPRATVTQELTHVELKSCPGGYVDLRTLTFDEMNVRKDIAARMYQEEARPLPGRKQQRPTDEMVRSYLEVANKKVTEFEFRNCIVDHNLEDENGNLIDFTLPMQAWRLDPKVGQEIDSAIGDLTAWDDEEESGTPSPLLEPVSSFSPTEPSTPSSSTDET